MQGCRYEFSDEPERLVAAGLKGRWFALFLSLLSPIHTGWRDFNVGNRIGRIFPRDFSLRATGWVKSVPGVQSPIGAYLVALWPITYFGGALE